MSAMCTTAPGVPLVAGETFPLGLAAVTPLCSGHRVPGSQVVSVFLSYKDFHAVGYLSEGGENKPEAKSDVTLYLFVLQPWLHK